MSMFLFSHDKSRPSSTTDEITALPSYAQPPPSNPMKSSDSSSLRPIMQKRRFFGRAFGAAGDLFQNNRFLHRREQVNELHTTIDSFAWPKPPAIHSIDDNGSVKLMPRDNKGNVAFNMDNIIPNPVYENEEASHSVHRTRPLSPEEYHQQGGSRPGSRRPSHANPLLSHPPSALKRSKTSFSATRPGMTSEGRAKTSFSIPKASTSFEEENVQLRIVDKTSTEPYGVAETKTHALLETTAYAASGRRSNALAEPRPSTAFDMRPHDISDPRPRPLHLQHRPEIPLRKDSLPVDQRRKDSIPAERQVFLDLVEETVKSGHFRDSTQSVTAYVSAEYSSEMTVASTLSMTSWLSDPDGPPDDLAPWNRPSTSMKTPTIDSLLATSQPNTDSLAVPTPARPGVGPRSKTAPIYSNAMAPVEQEDAAYDRILREKLKHHAGQVKKRLDTSTYYSPTVRQNEIEVHLAFVRAAEEILKQSPIWYGSATPAGGAIDQGARMNYLLRV